MSVEREMSLAEWCAKLPSQHVVNRELAELEQQLAALAEQNEKYRKVIPHCGVGASGYAVEQLFIECLALPDLASPVLNRIRADGMRMAAEILIDPMDRAAAQKIRAKADELAKESGK